MDLLIECRKRQAELLRILISIDHGELWASDDLAAERFKRNARATISQYEKIIHLLEGDQIGHA